MTGIQPTGDGKFVDATLTISQLFVNTLERKRLEFSNCKILGPGVIVLEGTQMVNVGFNAPDVDAIFWEIPPSRTFVVGAVKFTDCIFSSCVFEGVGVAGPPQMRDAIVQAFSGP